MAPQQSAPHHTATNTNTTTALAIHPSAITVTVTITTTTANTDAIKGAIDFIKLSTGALAAKAARMSEQLVDNFALLDD